MSYESRQTEVYVKPIEFISHSFLQNLFSQLLVLYILKHSFSSLFFFFLTYNQLSIQYVEKKKISKQLVIEIL